MLNLEGAQAGLSWITILKKRDNYRRAFDGFDVKKIARYDEAKVASLLADPGIVRNRFKIAATIGTPGRLGPCAERADPRLVVWRCSGQAASKSYSVPGQGAAAN